MSNPTSSVHETPPRPVDTTGPFSVREDSFLVQTNQRVQLLDITDTIVERVRRSGIRAGLVNVFSLHTTCALFVNEAQQALHADILRLLGQIVDRDAAWLHNDPQHSDCDRMNADSHLRAMVLGHSITLQVSGGKPVLGQWQRVLVAEMDGPRPRSMRIQTMGVV